MLWEQRRQALLFGVTWWHGPDRYLTIDSENQGSVRCTMTLRVQGHTARQDGTVLHIAGAAHLINALRLNLLTAAGSTDSRSADLPQSWRSTVLSFNLLFVVAPRYLWFHKIFDAQQGVGSGGAVVLCCLLTAARMVHTGALEHSE
jgi:hypothetical protein